MRYLSTRDTSAKASAAQAIAQGLAPDGGLYVPETLPKITAGDLRALADMPYRQRAAAVMGLFLDDYDAGELEDFARKAYGPDNFDGPSAAPVVKTRSGAHFLELWHGRTCAFKDMALLMLPHLLSAALGKTARKEDACILVATSGDTGKAALEGFRDVPRTKIMVFYPADGVSDVQRLQMVTQEGENVGVSAVSGNFDDAQTGVKHIFSDEELREQLRQKGYFLSSANSINWGRLLPQIAYYVSACCDLLKAGDVGEGELVNFCVPTGNFGNILAGWYAKQMGLPIGRLICASNANDVLYDFFRTGVYDRNRPFYTTISPSMDILVSSNLERLLFDMSGRDPARVRSYMSALAGNGRYQVPDDMRGALGRDFAWGRCGEEETKAAIRAVWEKDGYLIDPHTAVACGVLDRYRAETGDTAKTVVVSTASPFKFCGSVLDALGHGADIDEFEKLERLEALTGVQAPEQLRSLRGKPVRFDGCVDKGDMRGAVLRFLA